MSLAWSDVAPTKADIGTWWWRRDVEDPEQIVGFVHRYTDGRLWWSSFAHNGEVSRVSAPEWAGPISPPPSRDGGA